MLTATKIGIIIIALGSALDFVTTNIALSMPALFKESNTLYYTLGSTTFNLLYLIVTITVILFIIAYDRKYSTENQWTTSFGSLAIASLYGGAHLYLGVHNIQVFLNVMGSV